MSTGRLLFGILLLLGSLAAFFYAVYLYNHGLKIDAIFYMAVSLSLELGTLRKDP